MTTDREPSARALRRDAQRNRERILAVAQRAFAEYGAKASLDDIARAARVGPGTLYRHFPSREELLKAVYQSGVEGLAAAEKRLAETLPPVEALRAWMELFVDHLAAKRIIAPELNALSEEAKRVLEGLHTPVWEAIRRLVNRAIESGDIRQDLDPIDLLRAIIGVANVATAPDWQQGARRLVDILILGSRPGG